MIARASYSGMVGEKLEANFKFVEILSCPICPPIFSCITTNIEQIGLSQTREAKDRHFVKVLMTTGSVFRELVQIHYLPRCH